MDDIIYQRSGCKTGRNLKEESQLLVSQLCCAVRLISIASHWFQHNECCFSTDETQEPDFFWNTSSFVLHSLFASFASASSFSVIHCFVETVGLPLPGNSLGLDLKSSIGRVANRRRGLVVRAVKYVLCQTKRNRSRKSLARTHGFRKRMSITKGRATIKSKGDGKRDDGICAQKQIPTVENELEAEGFILEDDWFLDSI